MNYYVFQNEEIEFCLMKLFLAQIYKDREEENISFLRSFDIFLHLPKGKLQEIFLSLQTNSFKKNQIIYTEGQQPDNIYFVRSGEVEV
mgnify:CR=1 FL=1